MNTAATPANTRVNLVGLQSWLLLVLAGYWVVLIHRLSGMWSALPEYSYGWVVPMLCAMMFWERWRSRPASLGQAELGRWAFLVLALSASGFVLMRVALEVIPNWRLPLWGMAFSVMGMSVVALNFLGQGRWARHFFFPVAFLLVAIPWPDRFEGPFIQSLTQLNATITVELLSFFGVTAVRMGNLILIEPGMVGVQEACSGIRSFQSTLMVALFLGELFRFNLWRRLVFVVLGASCSMLFNILRTSFLVGTCHAEGLSAVDKFHDPAGWAVFGASFATLALIGWFLRRGDAKEKATQRRQPATRNLPSGHGSAVANLMSVVSNRGLLGPLLVMSTCLLLAEGGLRWWFGGHHQKRVASAEWSITMPEAQVARELPITREVKAMLSYDRGQGWEWSGTGGDRWQAFLFSWDAPHNLGDRILSTAGATGHLPEMCFTRAGMQLRQVYGRRWYHASGVPLVFKVYEFADRNVPIFVFACTWERGVEQRVEESFQIGGMASTKRAIQETYLRFRAGDRGIQDEVRVFKLGVWGPRTIGEAEVAFQQQLNQLVSPAAPGANARR